MNEKCSVIVPCYNVENYIVDCVDRLHNQTYRDLEIVLIDDGSTDNTFHMCAQLEKEYDDVIMVTHNYSVEIEGQEATRNRGLEATRNRGLEAATGNWICFVDADDWIENEAIQRSIEMIKKDDADIAVFGFDMLYKNKSVTCLADIKLGLQDTQDYISKIGKEIPWQFFSCVGNKLYRRSFIERNHLRFDKNYKYNEDSHFFITVLKSYPKITFVNKSYYRYVQRDESINHSYKVDLYTYANRMLTEYKKLLEMYHLTERFSYVDYRRLYAVYYALRDELQYNGYKGFRKLLLKLMDDETTAQSLQSIDKTNQLSSKERLLNKLILHRWTLILAMLTKIREKQVYTINFKIQKEGKR